ncbi:MAG TPA: helix-turn-helix domain-containing protein [Novosphingobium sp.]|nr:helix-turn-helix domain-containing protein [Novosphingobium sp.]
MGQTKAQLGKFPSHVRIYKRQMCSAAWRHLSGSAVKVLLAMAAFERGENNGAIFFSDRKGAEITGLSRNTVARAIHELIEKGFIYCTERGGFNRKTPHAACYGLTWVGGPKGSKWRAPSHAYEEWFDGNKRPQILTETGPIPDSEVETGHLIGPKSQPDWTRKRDVSAIPASSRSGPQTVYQGLGREGDSSEKRKQGNSSPQPSRLVLEVLRSKLISRLDQAGPGEQSRLARSAGIPGGTLSKFRNGKNLPDTHAVTLARELTAATVNADGVGKLFLAPAVLAAQAAQIGGKALTYIHAEHVPSMSPIRLCRGRRSRTDCVRLADCPTIFRFRGVLEPPCDCRTKAEAPQMVRDRRKDRSAKSASEYLPPRSRCH